MKFSALREDFLIAVQTAQYSASAKGMMPILSGVRIEASAEGLVIHSTDLESYTVTGCSANVEQDGVCVVNLKLLMDFLRDSRDEKIVFELIGNELKIEGQKTVFKLFTMPPEDFPNAPVVDIPVLEELESRVFTPAVQKVSRAASKDEKRPTLLGILFELEDDSSLRMVSTDSYRLAIVNLRDGLKVLEKGEYIVPASAMLNISRVAGKSEKIKMFRDENKGQIRFEASGSSHIVRLIEGKFPKYSQFIPESLDKKAEVDKEEMMGALKRASLVSPTLKMKVGQDGLTVASESREVGEGKEVIAAAYDGEEMEIAFNSRFLEDGILSVDGEKVLIGLSEPLKPGVIKEKEREEFLYIIMPIRI